MKQEWATEDNELPYVPDLHVGGTVQRPNGITFWLTRPRSKGISVDEWETQEQAKWDRIFGKKRGNK